MRFQLPFPDSEFPRKFRTKFTAAEAEHGTQGLVGTPGRVGGNGGGGFGSVDCGVDGGVDGGGDGGGDGGDDSGGREH